MPRPASQTDTKPSAEACPHVDRNDPRCGGRFRLGHIDQAYTVCFGCFRGCPMYHRINRELHAADHHAALHNNALHAPANDAPDSDRQPLIALTAHGRNLPLRATGS